MRVFIPSSEEINFFVHKGKMVNPSILIVHTCAGNVANASVLDCILVYICVPEMRLKAIALPHENGHSLFSDVIQWVYGQIEDFDGQESVHGTSVDEKKCEVFWQKLTSKKDSGGDPAWILFYIFVPTASGEQKNHDRY